MVSQSGEDSFKSKIKFKYLLVNLITTSSSQGCYLGQHYCGRESQSSSIVSSGWKKK
jgi:hypothetical protein